MMPDRLAQDRRGDALRSPLDQLHRERAADAVAEVEELADAQRIHHAELVVGERAPGIVDRQRASGLAAGRVALIHGDHAEVVLELLGNVDNRARPDADVRVQPAAGRGQEREARADLGVADAHVATLIEPDLGARGHALWRLCLRL
jgi:hypothetical protein